MVNRYLYTIGYEGLSWEEFLKKIKSKRIKVLIDVRAISNSRKRGFSKSELKANLTSVGILYLHLVNLGTPKELRTLLKETGNFRLFAKQYKKRLHEEKEKISEVTLLIMEKDCCLLCFEKDAEYCHRTIIAEEVIEKVHRKLEVVNL
jgi:uncharacterized protein (DUF488 family)